MYLEAVFIGAYVFPTIALVVQTVVLRRFLSNTSSISNEVDLERFKKVARTGMYLTAAVLPFLLAGFLSCILITRRYGGRGLVVVLFVNGVFFTVGKLGKKLEDRARSLKSSSEKLAAEYGRIGAAWVAKLFPNF